MQRSGSGIGGIVIPIAVVVIVFLGLSLLAGPGTSKNATVPAAIDDKSVTTTVRQTGEAVPATPAQPSE